MIIEQIKKFATNRNSSFPGSYSTLLIGPRGMTINFLWKSYKVNFFPLGNSFFLFSNSSKCLGPGGSLIQPCPQPVYESRSFINKASFTLGMRKMPTIFHKKNLAYTTSYPFKISLLLIFKNNAVLIITIHFSKSKNRGSIV